MNFIEGYEADFTFLGQRAYVHGTSMTKELLAFLQMNNISGIDRIVAVYIKKFSHKGIYLLIQDEEDDCYEEIKVAEFYVYHKGEKYHVILIDNEKIIDKRIAYDEDGMIAAAEIDAEKRFITFSYDKEMKLINVLIALNKKLLLTLVDNAGYSSWLTGKYDILWDKLNQEVGGGKIVIKLVSVLSNRYTKSDILANDKKYGSIYFAR